MVDWDNDGLDSLHDVDPTGPLLAPHHPVSGREVHVLGPSQHDACHGHIGPEVVGDILKLRGCDCKPTAGGPHIAIMPADCGFRHQLGGQKLVINIALPTHCWWPTHCHHARRLRLETPTWWPEAGHQHSFANSL